MPKVTITREERATLLAAKTIAHAITGAVRACPQGAHTALLYPPLMPWLTYPQFSALMSFLVKAKLLRRDGDHYYPAEVEAAE